MLTNCMGGLTTKWFALVIYAILRKTHRSNACTVNALVNKSILYNLFTLVLADEG